MFAGIAWANGESLSLNEKLSLRTDWKIQLEKRMLSLSQESRRELEQKLGDRDGFREECRRGRMEIWRENRSPKFREERLRFLERPSNRNEKKCR